MGFLSYAQNFEDVMLWRALGHIPNGIYVDVGAQHPRIDSISRAFYEHGWRGIHVEPVPAFADMLRQDRPDEIVLQVALGATEGTLELNIFADTGLSTAIPTYAERHQTERGYEVQRMHVPVLTLKSALASVVEQEVHWLKIDVEGFEEQVLRGWDSTQLRPWVLVVEATIPNSPVTDYAGWEPLVTAAGYQFVYFDGLNRFYIANEHPELAAAFAVPPNIFDTVELSGLASWGLCNVSVANERALTDQVRAQLQQAQGEFAAQLQQAEGEFAEQLRQAEGEFAAQLQQAEGEFAAQLEEALAGAALAAGRIAELEYLHLGLSEQATQGTLARHRVAELEGTLREQAQLYEQVRAERDAVNIQLALHMHKADHWWRTAETLRDELSLVYRSRSWRVSVPLRQAGLHARRARNFAKRVLNWARRKLGGQVATVAAPEAAKRDDAVVTHAGGAAVSRPLSRGGARLYQDLKKAVDEGKK